MSITVIILNIGTDRSEQTVPNSVENSILDGCPKISNFQLTLNALNSHINFSVYNVLLVLRTYFPYVSSIMNNFILGLILTYR